MSNYDAVFDALHKVNVSIATRDTQITRCQSDIAIAKAKQQECEGKYETAKNKTNNEFPDGLPPKNRGKMTKPRERYDSLKGRQDAARWEAEKAGRAVRALERQLHDLESRRRKLQDRAANIQAKLDYQIEADKIRNQKHEEERQRRRESAELKERLQRMEINVDATRGKDFARQRAQAGAVSYDSNRYAEGSNRRRGRHQQGGQSSEQRASSAGSDSKRDRRPSGYSFFTGKGKRRA